MSKTPEEVKQRLRAEGITVHQWALRKGFNVRAVRAVIYGHNKGNYGQAHNIAVALGMKKALK